ncbi:hypothetical protein CsSME_00008873 [Camellia sinensis var. sinensis]
MNRDKGIDKALKPRRPGHRRHRRVRPENNGHGSGGENVCVGLCCFFFGVIFLVLLFFYLGGLFSITL